MAILFYFSIDKLHFPSYTVIVRDGEVAQMARAPGSYPVGREFNSLLRYHLTKNRYFISGFFIIYARGYSLVAEYGASDPKAWVRFPLPAPITNLFELQI